MDCIPFFKSSDYSRFLAFACHQQFSLLLVIAPNFFQRIIAPLRACGPEIIIVNLEPRNAQSEPRRLNSRTCATELQENRKQLLWLLFWFCFCLTARRLDLQAKPCPRQGESFAWEVLSLIWKVKLRPWSQSHWLFSLKNQSPFLLKLVTFLLKLYLKLFYLN